MLGRIASRALHKSVQDSTRGAVLLARCVELGLGRTRPTYGQWDVRAEQCPFCKPHRNDPTNMYALSINTEQACFNCFRCGNGGDLSRIVQVLQGDTNQNENEDTDSDENEEEDDDVVAVDAPPLMLTPEGKSKQR